MCPSTRLLSRTGAVALLACLFVTARAQNPPGIEWRRIRTEHFDIVFPAGVETDASDSANALETFYGPMSASFGVHPRRVTVRLENQAPLHYVGGYVSLAPLQAVWNTARPQFTIGTNKWIDMLAAHEGRHLIQMRAMDRGFVHAMRMLFGDAGFGFVTGYSMPIWWLEGDASVAESAFTAGGTARLASFSQIMRANLMSGRRFSYMKAMYGSYNHVVPDRYQLGAYMVGRVNRASGSEAWDAILRDYTRTAWNPFALSMAMKKETGRGVAETYDEMATELREKWESKAEPIPLTSARAITAAPHQVWTSYYYGDYDTDGAVLADKGGLGDLNALVRINPDGEEERLFAHAPASRISVARGRVVWAEWVPDPRWRRGYSEILVYDLAIRRTRRLTHRTRFEAPALSPDGTRIAAIEYSAAGVSSLVILDANTGAEVKRIATPANDVLQTPSWAPDLRRIVAVRQQASGAKGLAILDTDTGLFTDIVAPSRTDMSWPSFAGDYVVYVSSLSGINNVYAVHTATHERYQVTSSRFGADCPRVFPDGRRLLFSDYTVDGYNLAEMPLDPANWRPIDRVQNAGLDYFEHGAHDYTAEMKTQTYRSEAYHPMAHLFNIHSWGVTSPPPGFGFGLISTDRMGLLNTTAAFTYDLNEQTTGLDLSGTFNALYPMIDFGFSRKNREARYPGFTEKWTERTARTGFHIPLNFSRGVYSTWLVFGSAVERRNLSGGGLTPLNYWLWFGRFRYSAPRDVAPAWGESFLVSYQHTPWGNDYRGNLTTATGTLYLPSPIRHHGIRLEAGNERRNGGNYYFSSQMNFARGYDSVAGNNLWKGSANYSLPLAYPDLAAWQVAYVKRVTGNFFYDYARAGNRLYRSAGAEALFDFHAFSAREPLRVGLRYAWRVEDHGSRVEPFIAFQW